MEKNMPELSATPLVEVTFTTTRSDASTPFWWESTDPAITAMKSEILRIAQEKNVPTEFQVVNSTTAKQTYRFFNTASWREDFWPAVQAALPGLVSARTQYYSNAGHTLQFKMANSQTGAVISELTL